MSSPLHQHYHLHLLGYHHRHPPHTPPAPLGEERCGERREREGWREKGEKKNKSRAISSLKWACWGVRNEERKRKDEHQRQKHVVGLKNLILQLRISNRKWQVTVLQWRSALSKVRDLHPPPLPGSEAPERNKNSTLWLPTSIKTA